MGEVIGTKLKEDQEEMEEIRKRRASIIIHGLRESTADDVNQPKGDDESQFMDLLLELKCDDVSK